MNTGLLNRLQDQWFHLRYQLRYPGAGKPHIARHLCLIKIRNALDCDLFDILETIPIDNAQDVIALEQQGEANGR